MRRLDNSSQNLLHINSNIHNVMALALICVGNDISLDCLAFQANSPGQPTGSATPPLPHSLCPLPSATNEKDISRHWEGRPSRSPWPPCVSVLPLTGFDASGVAAFPARRRGWAGRTFLTASLHSQPPATTLLPSFPPPHLLPTCSSPSLPAPLTLSYNNSNDNLYLCNTYENTIIKRRRIQNNMLKVRHQVI